MEFCDGTNWIVAGSEPGSFTCGVSTVKDADNNSYDTVLINAQCWMATNLKYDGSTAGDGCRDVTWGGSTDVGGCGYYGNATSELAAGEGLLYQWSAAMNGDTQEGARGICPSGWHIPTDAEWHTLEDYFDSGTCDGGRIIWGCTPAGTALKSGGSSGFDGLLAGSRYTDGNYYDRGTATYLWSSTPSDTTIAWRRALNSSEARVYRLTRDKALGFSVRCLKD